MDVTETPWAEAVADEMPAAEVRLLGEPEVSFDGRVIVPSAGQQQVLLVALALERGRPVRPDQLIDALWGDRPPASAGPTLRGLVARLRRVLGGEDGVPWLCGHPGGYLLDLPYGAVDTERFLKLAQRARSCGDAATTAGLLSQALALWRGPALGVAGDLPFAAAAAARLSEARLTAIEDLAAAELALDRVGDALARLEPCVTAYPLRERPAELLMRALYRQGRQADALGVYRGLRTRLAEELGVDPSPRVRDLEVAVLRHTLDDAPVPLSAPAPIAPWGASGRHNLPAAVTAFIGRLPERARVLDGLGRARLVTLAGPGGVGKTRLACEVARESLDRFPDGAWLVDLTPLRDPDQVPGQVADAVSLDAAALAASGREFTAALCDQLRHRRLLLVLDNCEHLVDAAARLTSAVLAACPRVTVLATSREVLAVPGEVVVRLDGLSLPPAGVSDDDAVADSDAGALFCARAADSTPGFALSTANAAAVTRICHRLDGIPLALELAAARMRLLGAARLADHLDQRLDLRAGSVRTVDPRHRTLQATLDWSHALLAEPEQLLLRRLSVVRASWTLEAAEALATAGPDLRGVARTDVIDLVARLIDKSLVLPLTPGAGQGSTDPRYRLLATVREYAADKLAAAGETEATRARHRSYLLAESAEGLLDGWCMSATWLHWVDQEMDNLRAALEWSDRRGDGAEVATLAVSLRNPWSFADPVEGATWLTRAIAAVDGTDSRLRVDARIGLSYCIAALPGNHDRRHGVLREALEIAVASDDPQLRGWAEFAYAEWLVMVGRLEEAVALVQGLPGRLTSPGGRILAAIAQTWHPLAVGDLDAARTALAAAIPVVAERPEDYTLPHLQAISAVLLAAAGDAAAAWTAAADAVAASRRFPSRLGLVMALTRAAEVALISNDVQHARTLLDELLDVQRDLGSPRWVAESLEVAAGVLVTERPRSAATCLGAARALRDELSEDGYLVPVLGDLHAQTDLATVSALGSAEAASARAAGASLHLAELLHMTRTELAALAV